MNKDIDWIVNACEFAFFAELVKHYPEITTGSFPPDASFEFRNACKDAIGTWLKCNGG